MLKNQNHAKGALTTFIILSSVPLITNTDQVGLCSRCGKKLADMKILLIGSFITDHGVRNLASS